MTDHSGSDSQTPPSVSPTDDGSHTLYSTQFDQHYHNPNGAVAESRHVFFEVNGLLDTLKSGNATPIDLLEIGFGTGLNLLLLLDAVRKHAPAAPIRYHTVEAWPIAPDTARQLNYSEHLELPEHQSRDLLSGLFEQLRDEGSLSRQLDGGVQLHVFKGLFEAYDPAGQQYDFIFHDAFSPRVNPELWTGNVFRKLIGWSRPEARLSTYCAASKARGAMAWAGWKVARAPGALGKREMTLASPAPDRLASFKRVNEERLARRYEQDDF